MRRFSFALFPCCAVLLSGSILLAADGFMGVVTGSPGKVMDGNKVLGTVPKGTRLWVFQDKAPWFQVKLPGKEQRGWMQGTAIERVRLNETQLEKLKAAHRHFDNYKKHKAAERYREAIAELQLCLAGDREVRGNDHPDTAGSLNNLGLLAREQGAYTAAREYYEEALATYRKVLGNEHTDTARTLNNLGILIKGLGDHAAARKYYEEALAIYRKVLGNGHTDTAMTLNNLGALAHELGDYEDAGTYYAEALAIRRKVLGNEHLHTANTLNNLGNLANNQGDYAAARRFYEEALMIKRKVVGNEHTGTASTLNNLGILVQNQGDYAAARKYHEEALTIYRKVLGNEHPRTAGSLNSLGILVKGQGDNVAARKYYEEALRIYRKVLGNEHPDTAMTLNHLGVLVKGQGDHAAARKYYEEALRIYRKVLGNEHTETAATLNNLGVLVSDQGNYVAARKYYEEAMRIKRKALGNEHPDTAMTLENLAWLSQEECDFESAGRTLDECRRIVRRYTLRTLTALSRKEQVDYLENLYTLDLHEALSLARANVNEPPLIERSAAWLINGKSVAEEALATSDRIATPASEPLLKRLRETRDRIAALSNKKASDERNRQLSELRATEQTLVRDLAATSGRDVTADPWIDLDNVRRNIPAQAMHANLIRMRPYDSKAKKRLAPIYVAWLVPAANAGEIRIVDLGDAEAIDAAVAACRQAMSDAPNAIKQTGEVEAAAAFEKTLAALAELIWKPLAEALAESEELILSPDGALWLVPWAALPIEEGKLLLEKFRLRYVTCGRELVATAPAVDGGAPGPARIFADPDYDQTERAAMVAYAATMSTSRSSVVRSADNIQARSEEFAVRSASPIGRVNRLPFTGIEATLIAPQLKTLTKAEPRLDVEGSAQEAIVKSVRSPRVLVLATHGYFLPDQQAKQVDRDERLTSTETKKKPAFDEEGNLIENPLLRCGLLLAGCNQREKYTDPRLGDGVLTGMEVVNLDLSGTELVVLSACETGIGQVNNGEGVAGLRQAFQLAGAQAVVSTLWQIPDRQSTVIMNDFFTNLAAGQSRHEALRNAQLKMIQSRRDKYAAAHPIYWAAWTITGR